MRKLNVNRRDCWLAGKWWRRISRDQWRHLRNSRHNSRLLLNVHSSLFKTKVNWNTSLACLIMVLFWMYRPTLIRLLIFNHAIRFVLKKLLVLYIWPQQQAETPTNVMFIHFIQWLLGDDTSDSWATNVVSLIPSVQYAPRTITEPQHPSRV